MHFLLGVHFYLQNCHLLCELFLCVYFYLYIFFGIIIIYVVKICACIVTKNLLGIVCTAKPIQQSFNFTKFSKKLNNILDKGQI